MAFLSFIPSIDCPSGWTILLSGFTTSSDGGRSVAKSDDLPGLNDSLTGGFLISGADSSIAATLGGKFYYASLAVDPYTKANGVQLSISNSNLWSTSSDCVTSRSTPWTNPCWSTTLVYGNLSKGANSYEDKDSIAVDMNPKSPYYGDAYVAWDHYFANGTTAAYLARCDVSITCAMLSGGAKPPISRNQKRRRHFTKKHIGEITIVCLLWSPFFMTILKLGNLIPCLFRQSQ